MRKKRKRPSLRIRKVWRMNPKTRVKEKKRVYSRKKNRVKLKKILENGLK